MIVKEERVTQYTIGDDEVVMLHRIGNSNLCIWRCQLKNKIYVTDNRIVLFSVSSDSTENLSIERCLGQDGVLL